MKSFSSPLLFFLLCYCNVVVFFLVVFIPPDDVKHFVWHCCWNCRIQIKCICFDVQYFFYLLSLIACPLPLNSGRGNLYIIELFCVIIWFILEQDESTKSLFRKSNSNLILGFPRNACKSCFLFHLSLGIYLILSS